LNRIWKDSLRSTFLAFAWRIWGKPRKNIC
jgi:hypothetical protein